MDQWSLLSGEKPLKVSDYEEFIDPDDYDDENTHTSYSYEFQVIWGEETVEADRVFTRRVYGLQRGGDYSLLDQCDSVQGCLLGLVDREMRTLENCRFFAEMSCLVVYACQFLAKQPEQVKFVYDSTIVGVV